MSQDALQKSSLSFVLNFKTTELSRLDLPVEVRKPNMALVARMLTSQSIDVEPGSYFVTAMLPAGQELTQLVKVGAGGHESVVLSPDPDDESPHESHEVAHFLLRSEAVRGGGGSSSSSSSSSSSPRSPALEAMGGASPVEGRIRIFSGNVLRGPLAPRNELFPHQPRTTGDTAQLEVYGADAPLLVQLLRPNAPPLNVALPAAPNSSCTIVLTRCPDGTTTLDVQLEHQVADLMLRYRERGLFEQALVAGRSSGFNAESLLMQKKRDPIAAAVGAYTLLRFGQLGQLHDWSKNLWRWFDWLPDGCAIWGEHLARLGRHDEALEVFTELPKRGLPLFSDGLSYATDRLGLYLGIGEKEFEADKLRRAAAVLEELQRFCPHIEFGKPIMSYTGLNPSKPDDEPLGDFVPTDDGLDLDSLLN